MIRFILFINSFIQSDTFLYYFIVISNIFAHICLVYLLCILGIQSRNFLMLAPFTKSVPIGYGEFWLYNFVINSIFFHICNVCFDPNDPIIYDSVTVASEYIVDSIEAKINDVPYVLGDEQIQIMKQGVTRSTVLVICAAISATLATAAVWYFSKRLKFKVSPCFFGTLKIFGEVE